MKRKTKQIQWCALLENGTLRCTKPNHVSSRFIYEATNHRRSRFYFEAIGSELAVNVVASRAWPTSSAVRLITIVDAINGEPGTNFILQPKKNSPSGMKRETVEKFINQASGRLRSALLNVSTRIEEGDPKRILIADAEEWGADCIFLGASAANNLFEKFLLGSVATAIVARAHCSVEVVRSGY